MIEQLIRWLDSRLHAGKSLREALDHVFPDHWSFMLGEIALYSFLILVFTGVFLAMFFNGGSGEVVYHGSYRALDGLRMSAAYVSVLHLTFDVRAGLLIRQMHHWAALIFLAAIVLHMARIFFTAAYRRPRELNWLIGLTLLLFAMANGFFGYSIVGDLLSGAGVRIAYSVVLSIPLIGQWLASILFGGPPPADATIPRMYSLHIFVIPAILAVLIGSHLAIIWRQRHTNYPGPRRSNSTIVGSHLWPSYAAKSMGLFFFLCAFVAALGAFVQINPIWIYGPDNPVAIMPNAQPDWYLGWMEGALRLFPGVHLHLGHFLIPEVFFPGILFPTALFALLYAWPFLETGFVGRNTDSHILRLPHQQPFNTALGFGTFILILVFFVAGSDDVIAVAANTSVNLVRSILRVLFFVAPVFAAVFAYAICLLLNRHRSEGEAESLIPMPHIHRTSHKPAVAARK